MDADFEALLRDFKSGGRQNWSPEQERHVLEPYDYLLSNPGKDIRSTLIHAFNEWLRVPKESLEVVLRAVEMLHTASLLIDDVEDNSELRRGRQAAHLRYGAASTINAANYIYFSAMSLIRSTGSPAVVAIYEEEILNLHRGQGLELFWRDRCGVQTGFRCPSETEYVDMVNDKTGGLLRMAIRLMQALAGGAEDTGDDDATTRGREAGRATDYVPLANMIGILFQIRDDYMNLASTQYCREKGFCEDLTEGKFSHPVIHGVLSRHASAARLKEILLLKTSDVALKIEACEILEATGSLRHTVRTVGALDGICRAETLALGGNAALSRILDMLALGGHDGGEIRRTVEFARSNLLPPEGGRRPGP